MGITFNPLSGQFDDTGNPGTSAERVKVSAVDATGGYLEDKIIAGAGVTVTKSDSGSGVLILTMSVDESAIDHTAIANIGTRSHATIDTDIDALETAQTDSSEPTGFINRVDSNISFVDGTRTFTIAPAITSFDYYVAGTKYTKSASEDIIISNDEGLHYIYYNGSTLSETTTWVDTLITENALVAIVHWDVSAGANIFFGEERHGISMSGITHAYLHNVYGARLSSGGELGDILADDSSPDNTNAQFSNAISTMWDEDIELTHTARLSTANIAVYYRSGADADSEWSMDESASFGVLNTGTGNPFYNLLSGGNWSQALVSNNDYVLAHVFTYNDTTRKFGVIQGQAVYSTVGQARDGALTEVNNLVLEGAPVPEFVFLGTIIYQANSGYTNVDCRARIRSDEDGNDYVDLRGEVITRSGTSVTVTDHNALASLQGGTTDEYYHLTATQYSAVSALVSPANTYKISPSGGDYTTIQAALTANTSGGEVFIVYPGTYTSDTINFTANNQAVIGASDSSLAVVTAADATICSVGAFTGCSIENITMTVSAATAARYCVDITTGSLTITNSILNYTNLSYTGSLFGGNLIHASGDSDVKVYSSELTLIDSAGDGASTRYATGIYFEDDGDFLMSNSGLSITANSITDDGVLGLESVDTNVTIERSTINLTADNGTKIYGLDLNDSAANPVISIKANKMTINGGASITTARGINVTDANTVLYSSHNQFEAFITAVDKFKGFSLDSNTVGYSLFDGVFNGELVVNIDNLSANFRMASSGEAFSLIASDSISAEGLELRASDTDSLIITNGGTTFGDHTLELNVNGSGTVLNIEANSTINQDLSSDASPSFTGATLNGLTASKAVITTSGKALASSTISSADLAEEVASNLINLNQSTHGFTVLNGVYHDGTDWNKAQANSSSTLPSHLVIEVVDADNVKLVKFGRYTVTGHGFTVGAYCYSDTATAGTPTETEPLTGYSCPLFYVEDANTIQVSVYRPSAIGSGIVSDSEIGSIVEFGNATLPEGFLWINGQSLSTTTYADLFNKIGYRFGGSGSSFNAPFDTSLKSYDLTVTGADNWSTIRATGVPYKTTDGTWHLKFNIAGSVDSGTRTTYAAAITDVVFKNTGGFYQPIVANTSAAADINRMWVTANTGNITMYHASDTTTAYRFSGDVELNAKPSFVDDNDPSSYTINKAIRYAARGAIQGSTTPNPNYIINGDMRISQRGDFTSATAASHDSFYIDRWKSIVDTVTANKQHITASQPSALSGSKSLKYIATSSDTGRVGAYTKIEDYDLFAGKTITLSTWIKSNSSDARLRIFDDVANHYSSAHSGGGDWELLTVTANIDSSTTIMAVYALIQTSAGADVAISSGDYIEFTGVKLEISSSATDFVARPLAEELRLCQRYYEKSYNIDVAPGGSSGDGAVFTTLVDTASATSTLIRAYAPFKVTKRSDSGTIAIYGHRSTYAINTINKYNGNNDYAITTSLAAGESSFAGYFTLTGGAQADTAYGFQWTYDCEL